MADEIWSPLESIVHAFWHVVESDLDEWRAQFVDDFRTDEERLAEFLGDEDSRDTLGWVLGVLRSLIEFSLLAPREPAQIDARVSGGTAEEVKPYVRALVALLAAFDAMRTAGSAGRARELVDMAFLHLNKFRVSLRTYGVFLTPYSGESVDQRVQRFKESAERVRHALSDADWDVLGHARMRDLR